MLADVAVKECEHSRRSNTSESLAAAAPEQQMQKVRQLPEKQVRNGVRGTVRK